MEMRQLPINCEEIRVTDVDSFSVLDITVFVYCKQVWEEHRALKSTNFILKLDLICASLPIHLLGQRLKLVKDADTRLPE